jgi:hypothetical protein
MLREFLTKPTSWILALALLLLVAQNAGLLGRASDVFGGQAQSVVDVQQHQELARKQDETNKKLDGITDQLRNNGNSNAVGLRVLCLQGAKTDQQRAECARIQ